jgi:hypothetical protein
MKYRLSRLKQQTNHSVLFLFSLTGLLVLALSCPILPHLISQASAQTELRISHPIFDDEYRNDWGDGSVNCTTNPKYDQWVNNGLYGLGATMDKDGRLIFKRPVSLDTNAYTGIAGFINGGESGEQLIGICVIDHMGRQLPEKCGLDLRHYTQGGSFPVDNWRLFAVPLKDFGPITRGIKAVCLVNAAGKKLDTFYLDDFGLITSQVPSFRKGAAGTIRAPKPVRTSKVFDDGFGKGWQDWSWDTSAKTNNTRSSSGKSCLTVVQNPNGGLAFGRHAPFLTVGYDTLEFHVMGIDPSLRVVLFDGTGQELQGAVSLAPKTRGESGDRRPEWVRVRIPLSKLEAEDTEITKIAIINTSSNLQMIYIDDVKFIKGN